jgi:hypothetical protein
VSGPGSCDFVSGPGSCDFVSGSGSCDFVSGSGSCDFVSGSGSDYFMSDFSVETLRLDVGFEKRGFMPLQSGVSAGPTSWRGFTVVI